MVMIWNKRFRMTYNKTVANRRRVSTREKQGKILGRGTERGRRNTSRRSEFDSWIRNKWRTVVRMVDNNILQIVVSGWS